MMDKNKGARGKGEGESRRKEDERRAAVVCAVAVVARRRSEGTHPINKTTRVTIEFNREKNGFHSRRSGHAGRGGRGGGGEGDPRSKSPSTYAPLLFIVPNFHSQWTAICCLADEEEEHEREERKREKNRFREWPRKRGAFGIRFLVELNDARISFSSSLFFFLFFSRRRFESTVTFARSEGTVARRKVGVDLAELKSC